MSEDQYTDEQLNELRKNPLKVVQPTIEWPIARTLYRHYKGGLYVVLGVGRMSEARDQLYVAYWSVARKTMWFRPLGMFVEEIRWPDGERRQRFTREDNFKPGEVDKLFDHIAMANLPQDDDQ